MIYPRTLVVSINAFRMGGSNGKVLAEFFRGWDKKNLAQFYVYNEKPDFPVCQNYYQVTDRDALYAFKTGLKKGRLINSEVLSESNDENPTSSMPAPPKTPLTRLLRDLVWNSCRWRGREFWQWIDGFKPELVFTMAGASSFIHKIAIDVSNHCRVPLVVYNTENYYFKNYNYLKGKGWAWLYPIYKKECDYMFRKLMDKSSAEIYNNKLLDKLYSEEFGRHGTIIYQSSALKPMLPPPSQETLRFSYAGNLGINRHVPLIEIGQALQQISSSYFLDVYGKASPTVEEQLRSSVGIRYHGVVPYNEVINIMQDSHFMVHAESFDDFWIKDLCTGFSTKISDILSAGKCLILYADASLACSKYVIDNRCGCVITNPSELKIRLHELIESKSIQEDYIMNGIKAAQRDMNGEKNSEVFYQVLNDVYMKAKDNN